MRMRKQKFLALGLAVLLAAGLALSGCAGGGLFAKPTPEPTAEPTPTPEPTATPAPMGNPLTGETDGEYANKRPVAVTLRTGEGAAPYWGISRADVIVAGLTEGNTAALTALYASIDEVPQVGPVGAARDLLLQFALPINAVPVHINKNVYARNLLNVMAYQDVDGYHVGKTAFAFDGDRFGAGAAEENCWYTNADLIRAGLAAYGASTDGQTGPLFQFAPREPAADGSRNATELQITFSSRDTQGIYYNPDLNVYSKNNPDGTPFADAEGTAVFQNVLVLYASSGIKDDGYTRQYDLNGGSGIYLYGGAWEPITWQKGDATAPLLLTAADGQPLTVAPGKTFLAIWGGHYGQSLRLLGQDGVEQTLPERPALLESGVPDDAAAAAEQEYNNYQANIAVQEEIAQLTKDLATAQELLAKAQEALAANPADEAAIASATEAQAMIDQINVKIEERKAALAATAPAETPAPETTPAPEETPAPAQ